MAARRRFTRRFRRRRARYTWLPVNGLFLSATGEFGTANIPITFTVPANGEAVTVITEVTFDSPAAFDTTSGDISANSNLGDAIANEYFIRRIVGNCFVEFPPQRDSDGDPSSAQGINVTAGLFIARSEEEDANPNVQPIGTATSGQRWNNYGSHALATIREPWIWRRQWILGNPAFRERNAALAAANTTIATPSTSAVGLGSEYPSTNVLYAQGSNQQIDQKTLRRVRDDNRFWAVLSAFNTQNVNAIQAVTTPSTMFATWDLRLLGALRKAKNVGSF